MNAGCLRPIRIVIPEGSMLRPTYPAAVVAGNVETSQHVTNAILAAMGAMANAQGTMNNLTFGNARHQYYETICSGAPAGRFNDGTGFAGADGVHTHMTNSRLTDPRSWNCAFPWCWRISACGRDPAAPVVGGAETGPGGRSGFGSGWISPSSRPIAPARRRV